MRYLIRASIEDTDPEVWRLLAVPSTVSLRHLHLGLQAAFGWRDYHLYSFHLGTTTYVLDDEDLDWAGEEARLIDGKALSTLLRSRRRFTYCYDFGDNWVVHLRIVGRDSKAEVWREHLELLDGERQWSARGRRWSGGLR